MIRRFAGQIPCNILDPLGSRRERGRDRRLRDLRALGGDDPCLLGGRDLLLQAADLGSRFGEFVSDSDRRHDGEPHIAHFAELCPHPLDALAESARKPEQVIFLAVETSHPVLMAVDGDVDLSHGASSFDARR